MLLAIVAWWLIELRKKGESGLLGDEAEKYEIFTIKLNQLTNSKQKIDRNRKIIKINFCLLYTSPSPRD